MDQKLLWSYHKEAMKLAMLNHEKIFREQVYELHRLYRVQRLLMNNMETAAGGIRRSDGSQGTIRSTVQMHGEQQVIDESEIQLTLGPSISKTTTKTSSGSVNHHHKRSSSGQSLVPSNSTVSSKIRSKDVATSDGFTWNFDASGKNGTQMNLGEDRLEKHPPWLFQTLSLNLTN